MTRQDLQAVLGWCTVINFAFMLFWFLEFGTGLGERNLAERSTFVGIGII